MSEKSISFSDKVLKFALCSGGELDLALYESDEGECAYPGYSRARVAADSGQWKIGGGQAENIMAITFPVCAGGGESKATQIAVSQDGVMKYRGKLSKPLRIAEGVAPYIKPGGLVVTEE
jgi:hypothetical protein